MLAYALINWGMIVMTMFAGWVTTVRAATAVKAASLSSGSPLLVDTMANIMIVIAGENIPRAFAVQCQSHRQVGFDTLHTA